MRRLGFFVVSLLMLTSLSISVAPQKAFAIEGDLTQVTQADYDALKTVATEIDQTVQGLNLNNSSGTLLSSKYLDILKDDYNSTKTTPNTTRNSLEVQVFNDYIIYLKSIQTNGKGASDKDAASAALILIQQKFDNAVTRLQFERGTISSDEVRAQNATSNQKANDARTALSQQRTEGKCTTIFNSSIVDCIDSGIAWLIRNTFLQIANFLFLIAAQILNISIVQGIYNFGKIATDALYQPWLFIRQVVSLFLMFGTLVLAFFYMIGREQTFTKYFAWMIIFGLFVNFSYPVMKSLAHVSNVISLDFYAATVGPEALTSSNSSMAAGTLLQNKLGIIPQVEKVNDSASTNQTGVSNLRTTPNVVLLLILVLYAAYVLFMVAGILIARTVLLIVLIPASPILLIDSVVPRLGEAAVKMRKLFFEQLIVAPVFMVMLALTLKFMDIFKSTPSDDAATIFFNLIISIILLHIMYKIVKEISGKAGQFATDIMGKVGGFGLGLASGGTGLLARSTIGAAASRMRGSAWLDEMQGSRTGRFMKRFSDSLAQSSFDTRNIGLVSKGMAKAGMGMGKGSTMTYDKAFAARQARIAKEYGDIKSDKARQGFYDQTRNGPLSQLAGKIGIETGGVKIARQLDLDEIKLKQQQDAQVDAFTKADDIKRKEMLIKAQQENNKPLIDRLTAAQNYFDIKAIKPQELKNRQSEAAIMKHDLAEDEKFYQAKAANYAQKVATHAKEGVEITKMETELKNTESSIQTKEQELKDKQKEIDDYNKGDIVVPQEQQRLTQQKEALKRSLDTDKRAYDDKKRTFDTKKQTHEQAKIELDHENAENTVLQQNLQAQRSQYQAKQQQADTEREAYINEAAQQKAKALAKTDSRTAMDIIEKDSYVELTQDSQKEIQALEKQLQSVKADSPQGIYYSDQIKYKKEEAKKVVEDMRDAVRRAYHAETSDRPANRTASASASASAQNASQAQAPAPASPNPNNGGGSSATSSYSGAQQQQLDVELPAYQAPVTGTPNTYAVSNQMQQLSDGSVLHQGTIYANAIEAARAINAAKNAGPTPPPRPTSSAPNSTLTSSLPTPRPTTSPTTQAPRPQSVSNVNASDSVRMPGWPGVVERAARAYSGPLPENDRREYVDPRSTAAPKPTGPKSSTPAPQPVTV